MSPLVRRAHLIQKDDILYIYLLKSICVEEEGEEGRFALDGESGEPDLDCAYARLIENGYTCQVFWGRWGRLRVLKSHLYT